MLCSVDKGVAGTAIKNVGRKLRVMLKVLFAMVLGGSNLALPFAAWGLSE